MKMSNGSPPGRSPNIFCKNAKHFCKNKIRFLQNLQIYLQFAKIVRYKIDLYNAMQIARFVQINFCNLQNFCKIASVCKYFCKLKYKFTIISLLPTLTMINRRRTDI